jgi:hypothetical protein
MKVSIRTASVLVAALALSVASVAHAQGDPSDDSVVQKLAHGQVDWSNKTVTATGSGAASLKAKSVAVARLKAERAAKIDALRNIIETIQGIQINAKRSAGDLMSNGEIKTKIMGMARNFKVVDTRYYSDGSVDVVVQMPIDDQLTTTLFQGVKQGKTRKLPATGAASVSGLIINAKSLGVVPSMAPRIVDEAGKEVYGASVVSNKGIAQGGIAGYVKDVGAAQSSERIGKSPMVMKALSLAKGTKTDIVISNADADKLRDPNSNLSFLSEGKVVIVVD